MPSHHTADSTRPAPRRASRWHRALVGAAALALVAGCSGSSGGDDAAPATDAPGAGASTTTTTTAVDPASAPEGEVATGEPVPSSGCGTGATEPVALERHELLGDRYYLLTTPPGAEADRPLPVVVDFHGLLEGAQVHALNSGFGPYAAEQGFIAVFPHGRGEPVKWEVGLDRAANPDLVYVDALLDQLEAERCVDTSRVYATGLSYGAIMSSTIGCAMTDRFAAIAPVDGLTLPDGCVPERAVPVLTFHGTQDPILLFNGGVANLGNILGGGEDEPEVEPPEADLDGEGYPATAAAWAEQNGCTGEPVDEDRTDTVIERTWDCPAAAPVVFEIMVGAGHSWPGSAFSENIEDIVGPTDPIDGTDVIWRFFQRFQLPAS